MYLRCNVASNRFVSADVLFLEILWLRKSSSLRKFSLIGGHLSITVFLPLSLSDPLSIPLSVSASACSRPSLYLPLSLSLFPWADPLSFISPSPCWRGEGAPSVPNGKKPVEWKWCNACLIFLIPCQAKLFFLLHFSQLFLSIAEIPPTAFKLFGQ